MGIFSGLFRSRDKPQNRTAGSAYSFFFGGSTAGNIAYVMAKHAGPSVPDTPEEWLDGFNTFSIYQILPQIIDLWGLNVKTDVESKKNFARLSGR